MEQRKLDLYPKARLLHLVAGTMRGNVAIRQFATFPITTPRPASGTYTESVQCPECGSRVAYKIWSQEVTRRARIGWLALAIVGAIGLPILIATSSQGDDSPLPGGVVALLFFAFVAAAIGGLVQWWKEDGVRLQKPPAIAGPTGLPDPRSAGRHAIGFPVTSTRTYTKT